MSGVIKSAKKVFKKVGKFVKKIIKPVAIAVAAYFTAGVALSFIPATSAFAASLPGFASGGLLGTGLGAGATAGTGIFSSAANAIGLGGGLLSGAAAAGTGAAELGAIYGTSAALGAVAPNAMNIASVAGSAGTGAASAGGAAVFGAGGKVLAGTSAASAGAMSLTDKLLLAKVGTDVAGALFGPSPEELYAAEAEEKAKFRGAYYGMEAGGQPLVPGVEAPALPGPSSGGQQVAQAPPVQPNQLQAPELASADEGLYATKINKPKEEVQSPAGLYGEGQMKQNIPIPTDLFAPAPGVRYV